MTDERNVEMLLSPAAYVIRKLGGLTKTANKLGLAVSTVQGWQIRGRIPQSHWAPAIDAAKAEGDTLALADFLNDHSVEGEESAA
jgi:hypothetical protein